MPKQKSTQLNCFSPPVMIATFAVEIGLAFYAIWRYKLSELTRLVAMILVMLATFQFAEYFVCTGSIGNTDTWSRIGFAAITTLPPLGLHLMHVLANKPNRRLVGTAYASMAGFIGFFLLFPGVFNSYQCTGNYAIFHLIPKAGGAYWIYYMGWIFATIVLGIKWLRDLNKTRANLVQAMNIGLLVFLVPTGVTNLINPATKDAIPSIMCGFAVIFALVLAVYILPRAAETKLSGLDKHAK